MDLAVIIVLLVLVIVLLKDIKWVTYLIGILEIFFRLSHYIGDNLGIPELESFVDRTIPSSLFSVISNYTSGTLCTVLCWVVVIFLVWFLIYLIKYLIKRK